MDGLIHIWQQMEDHANFLDKVAESYLIDKDVKLNMDFINQAQAYSRDEISNVFDKAPAGKKIKTLAKFLEIDAKRVYKILQNN